MQFQIGGMTRAHVFTQAKPTVKVSNPSVRFGGKDPEIEKLKNKRLTFVESCHRKDAFIRMVMEVENDHVHSEKCGHGLKDAFIQMVTDIENNHVHSEKCGHVSDSSRSKKKQK